MPGDRRAPIVAGNRRGLFAQGIQLTDHVADQMQQRVFFDFGGSIGAAIAAHVRGDRVEAGFGQGAELMAPGIPGLREAVAKDDQRTFALLCHVHPDSVGLDRAVPHLVHGSLHSKRAHGRLPSGRGWH